MAEDKGHISSGSRPDLRTTPRASTNYHEKRSIASRVPHAGTSSPAAAAPLRESTGHPAIAPRPDPHARNFLTACAHGVLFAALNTGAHETNMMKVSAMLSEERNVASDPELDRRRQGALHFFTSWARITFSSSSRCSRPQPYPQRPALGRQSSSLHSSLGWMWAGWCRGLGGCVARSVVERGASARLS